jgi:hypothetical protein
MLDFQHSRFVVQSDRQKREILASKAIRHRRGKLVAVAWSDRFVPVKMPFRRRMGPLTFFAGVQKSFNSILRASAAPAALETPFF